MSKTVLANVYDIVGGRETFGNQTLFFQVVAPKSEFAISNSQINHYFTGRRKFRELSKYKNYVRNKTDGESGALNQLARIIPSNDSEEPVYNDLYNLIVSRYIFPRGAFDDYKDLYHKALIEMKENPKKYQRRSLFLGETMIYCFTADSKTSKSNVYNVNDIVNASFWVHQDEANEELAQDAAEYFKAITRDGANGRMGNRAVIDLARKGNAFGCFDTATLEEYGDVVGYPRYGEAYRLYEIAHNKGLALATWCLGFMHYMSYYSSGRQDGYFEHDYAKAIEFFRQAEAKGCAAAINSMGKAYYEGHIDKSLSDEERFSVAEKYFLRAKDHEYIYSYNNLGKLHEDQANKQKRQLLRLQSEESDAGELSTKEKRNMNQEIQTLRSKIDQNMEKAFKYYIEAADKRDSWAANRVGWFYLQGNIPRQPKDLAMAYHYFRIAISMPTRYVCKRAFYNIAAYFYRYGVNGICGKESLQVVIDTLGKAAEGADGVIDASLELLDIYEELIRLSPEIHLKQQYHFTGEMLLERIRQYLEHNRHKYTGSTSNTSSEEQKSFREKSAKYEDYVRKWQTELRNLQIGQSGGYL